MVSIILGAILYVFPLASAKLSQQAVSRTFIFSKQMSLVPILASNSHSETETETEHSLKCQ